MVKTVNTPAGGNDKLNSIVEQRNELSDKEQSELLEMFQNDKREKNKQSEIDELFGNKEAILKDLKENHVKVEENQEMLGHKGKIVHIHLPAIEGKFKGFKFDYFVSDERVKISDFENNPEYEKESYTMEEVSKLLNVMNKYMRARGIETEDMDYMRDIVSRNRSGEGSLVGDYLDNIADLGSRLYLADKNILGRENSRAIFGSSIGYDKRRTYKFYRYDEESGNIESDSASLFLKLSE